MRTRQAGGTVAPVGALRPWRWIALGILTCLGVAASYFLTRPDPPLARAPAATASSGPPPASALATAASAALKPLDSAVEVIVRQNDTLDGIFRRLQLSIEDLAAVRNLPGIRQSLDFLRPGDVVRLTHLNGELRSLERRMSDTKTLSVARRPEGDFAAQIVENPVDVRTEGMHGEISSSLFRTIEDLGGSDALAQALAEVFQYDIDFAQELQPGDTFALVVEKVYRNGAYLHDGEIIAAEFVNSGRTYRAVRYQGPNGKSDFYTPDGKSLRKAFLRAPLEFSRISSGFGLRYHPLLNRMRAHKGIDYAAPSGTPVRAAGDGRVRFRGAQGGYGNVMVLGHAGGIETVYGHLSRFARGLIVGERVKQGQLVGYVGQTGLATGPHLHYEYRVNGVHRNPATLKSLPAEPINPALKTDFVARTSPLLASLEAARTPRAEARP